MWQLVHPSLTAIPLPPRSYQGFHLERFALESQRPLDFHAHIANVTFANNLQTLVSKALVKRLDASGRKWRQVCETGICLRTSEVWRNGYAIRLLNWLKSLKVVTCFAYMRMTWDQIVSWPNVEHIASTCVRVWSLSVSKVHASYHNFMQVHSSNWRNKSVSPELIGFVQVALF